MRTSTTTRKASSRRLHSTPTISQSIAMAFRVAWFGFAGGVATNSLNLITPPPGASIPGERSRCYGKALLFQLAGWVNTALEVAEKPLLFFGSEIGDFVGGNCGFGIIPNGENGIGVSRHHGLGLEL